MRTNIDIDDTLMKQAMKATGATTKRAAVETAMRLAIQLHRQDQALKQLWGLGWEGDLKAMRQNRFPTWDRSGEPGKSRRRKSAA